MTFDLNITHKSLGNFNETWRKAQSLFSNLYGHYLPYRITPDEIDFDKERIKNFKPINHYLAIIIPTKDKIDLLLNCIQSIIQHTHIARYAIIIADTGSTTKNKEWLQQNITKLKKTKNFIDIRVIEYDYYNFAKINNDVVKNHTPQQCTHLLFCNNDIKL